MWLWISVVFSACVRLSAHLVSGDWDPGLHPGLEYVLARWALGWLVFAVFLVRDDVG